MKWQYRKFVVTGDEILDIPDGARCKQIRYDRDLDIRFVEWIEPVVESEGDQS